MEHRPGESGNHLCRIIQCLSFTSLRTLLAMAGKLDGVEDMLAALGGEGRLEGNLKHFKTLPDNHWGYILLGGNF